MRFQQDLWQYWALGVFFNEVLRIHHCHTCCKRWYFTFSDEECTTPAPIDGVVYMVHGKGAKQNLLRLRQIDGICEKVHQGIVRVGLRWLWKRHGVHRLEFRVHAGFMWKKYLAPGVKWTILVFLLSLRVRSNGWLKTKKSRAF